MEVKKTEKVVQVTVYIAEDGTEFSSPLACQEHEMNVERQKAERVIATLKKFESRPDLDRSDSAWEWYFVSNQEELDAVRVILFDPDSTAFEYNAPSFPCWIACVYDEDGMGSIAGTPEQVKEKMREFEQELQKMIEEKTP